jgi:hypothetical protein
MELNHAQNLKLKQRTMCTLANQKMLVYDTLQESLDFQSIRELEDFVIHDCIYTGLLKCKLDQKGRRIHVQELRCAAIPAPSTLRGPERFVRSSSCPLRCE